MKKRLVAGYLVGNEILYHHSEIERSRRMAREKNESWQQVWALIDMNWFYGTWQAIQHCKAEIFPTESAVWEAYDRQK